MRTGRSDHRFDCRFISSTADSPIRPPVQSKMVFCIESERFYDRLTVQPWCADDRQVDQQKRIIPSSPHNIYCRREFFGTHQSLNKELNRVAYTLAHQGAFLPRGSLQKWNSHHPMAITNDLHNDKLGLLWPRKTFYPL